MSFLQNATRPTRAPSRQSSSLVVTEEERFVLYYWSANDEPKLISSKDRLLWIRGSRRRKEVARIQRFVAQKLERGSVKIVCAGLCRQVDDAAIKASELSGRTVDFYFEFLDGFDDRKERYLAGLRLQHGNAVEQIFVRSRS